MTCSLCYNFGAEETTQHVFKGNQKLMKFVSLPDLRDAATAATAVGKLTTEEEAEAAKGCEECVLLWDIVSAVKKKALREEQDGQVGGQGDATVSNSGEEWVEKLDGFLEVKIAPGKPMIVAWRKESLSFEIFSRAGDPGPEHPSIGPAKEVQPDSSSPECFSLIRSWMSTCATSHPLCKPPAAPLLPTRSIRVGTSAETPRLVVTDGQVGRYAALSYCWGDPKIHGAPFKTTADNFDEHLKALPWAKLPATLREAVVFCREVGIEFLWIDAICIIQGDKQDWMRESGKMCDVYSNASLTIAADHGDGNSSGLFHQPQKYGRPPSQFHLRERTVYVRPELSKLHNDVTMLLRLPEGQETQPIHKRAWTFQEALLSHRVVHYTTDEIVWECNTIRDYECRRGNPVELDEESTRVFRTKDLFQKMGDKKVAYLQWRQIVQVFTERELSFDGDRLAALSGMARQFARMMEQVFGDGTNKASGSGRANRYLAGLWEEDLATQLLWTMEDDYWRLGSVKQRRPTEWRGPSWGWVGMEGALMFLPMSEFHPLLNFKEAEAEPIDRVADEYGRVKSAKLVVEGKVLHGLTVKIAEPRDQDRTMGVIHGKKYLLRDSEQRRWTLDDMHSSTTFIPDEPGETPNGTADLSILLVGTAGMPAARRPYSPFLVLRQKGAAANAQGGIAPGGRISGAGSVDGLEYERVGISFRGAEWETEGIDVFEDANEETLTLL